ncbi:MAG: glycosyltransferase [Candidatus Rokubacteria bacterium]|nr:glycosyltransferase [Candidatus Rokubacteria bacterium]
MKISVLCFDLADNAAGRADLLARLLAPRHQVEVVGPCFGADIWRPVRGGPVRYRSVAGSRLPRFFAALPRLLRLVDGDLVYASKPRPTSFGIGLLASRLSRRPLILDIDDWEVGFFYRSQRWGRVGRFLNLTNPNGLPWTWMMERLIRRARLRTVASRFLEARFGGVLIPHVRDTDAWSPGTHDPGPARSRLGVDAEKVVMFLGTPREHKGVDDLVEAVRLLRRPDLVLAIVGSDPGSRAGQRLRALAPTVRCVDEIPFSQIPHYLEAAHVVAAPQRLTSDTLAQVPAKLFDAMALGRPIVSTRVSMIPEILDGCGLVVEPGNPEALAHALAFLLDNPAEAAELGRRARARAEERYSYAMARQLLLPLLETAAGGRG